MTFDVHCYELAEHFLSDNDPTRERVTALASVIQRAIENWLEWERPHDPPFRGGATQ